MRFGKLSRLSATICVDATETSVQQPLVLLFFWDADRSSGLSPLRGQLRDDFFLDVAQAVLAEIDLVADEEGRGAERAARHRTAGVVDQLLLDFVLLGTGDDAIDVEPGSPEGITEDLVATPTPEPSSLMLLGSGLVSAAGLLVRRRRTV